MASSENARETGARKVVSREPVVEETDQDAAKNKAPETFGLSRPPTETNDKTRQSESRNPRGSFKTEATPEDHELQERTVADWDRQL